MLQTPNGFPITTTTPDLLALPSFTLYQPLAFFQFLAHSKLSFRLCTSSLPGIPFSLIFANHSGFILNVSFTSLLHLLHLKQSSGHSIISTCSLTSIQWPCSWLFIMFRHWNISCVEHWYYLVQHSIFSTQSVWHIAGASFPFEWNKWTNVQTLLRCSDIIDSFLYQRTSPFIFPFLFCSSQRFPILYLPDPAFPSSYNFLSFSL